jgi:hypothetical protein
MFNFKYFVWSGDNPKKICVTNTLTSGERGRKIQEIKGPVNLSCSAPSAINNLLCIYPHLQCAMFGKLVNILCAIFIGPIKKFFEQQRDLYLVYKAIINCFSVPSHPIRRFF